MNSVYAAAFGGIKDRSNRLCVSAEGFLQERGELGLAVRDVRLIDCPFAAAAAILRQLRNDMPQEEQRHVNIRALGKGVTLRLGLLELL